VCVFVCVCVIGSDEIAVINLKSLLFTARAGRTRPAGPPRAVGNANPLRQNGRRQTWVGLVATRQGTMTTTTTIHDILIRYRS